MIRYKSITKYSLLLILLSAVAGAAAKKPLALGGERHMFIDDYLVSKKSGVSFSVQPPQLRQTVLKDELPWEQMAYSSVIDDGKEYKLYYGSIAGPKPTCLAVSKDGINWEKPKLGIFDFNGSKENNILFNHKGGGHGFGGSAYYDEHDPDPNRRYKFFTCYTGDDLPNTDTTEGMVMYTSPDGVHFTKQEVQLLPFNADSQAVMFWDRYVNKYVCYMRGHKSPGTREGGRKVVRGETDDPMKPWPYTPCAEPFTNNHELAYATTQLPTVMQWDENDPIETDIYGSQTFLYPWAHRVYLAFPTMYYHYRSERAYLNPSKEDSNVGVGEVQLAVSRDGIKWTRYRRPTYIKAGWYGNHYCFWPWVIQGMIRRGNSIYQYVILRPTTHGALRIMENTKDEYPGLTLFEQKIDRFVAAEFDYTGGTLETEPFTFKGSRLILNVDTSGAGEGRVTVLNAEGKPIPGFEIENCDIVNGDWLDKTLSWKGKSDLSTLSGKPIKLKFEMRGSRLYAFQFMEVK